MQQLERSPRWQASASFRKLLALWPQLVGSAVAQHSQPSKIQRGVLLVSVSSAAWAQTLTFERLRILEKLHQQIPTMVNEIQEIRFATARWQPSKKRSHSRAVLQLIEHPSWVQVSHSPVQPPPKTADEAFQQWSKKVHSQHSSQSLCPECHCPCPTAELSRWPVCAICMSHRWQTPLAQKR